MKLDNYSEDIEEALAGKDIVVLAPRMTAEEAVKELDAHLHGRNTTVRIYLFVSDAMDLKDNNVH